MPRFQTRVPGRVFRARPKTLSKKTPGTLAKYSMVQQFSNFLGLSGTARNKTQGAAAPVFKNSGLGEVTVLYCIIRVTEICLG